MSSMRTILLRLRGLGRDERGVAAVFVALSLLVLMGFSAFAVDLGYLHLKRSNMQNAADLAALAGANALVSHGDDLAAVRAIVLDYARANLAEEDGPDLAVGNADVIFMRDGVVVTENANQVELAIERSIDRGNAVGLLFGPIIGRDTANLRVSARAGLVGICSSACVKPFMVPTKFSWDDTAAGVGSAYYENGQLDEESPEEMASAVVIGYGEEDLGTQILIKPGEPQLAIIPSHYNLVDLPPVNKGTPITGADAVRENIAGCTGSNTMSVDPGDEVQLEPGNSAGPVAQGTAVLMADDPYAYWDAATNSIQGSAYPDPLASSRVIIIAFYNPLDPPVSGRNSIMVYQMAAVFIEGADNKGNVTARFIRAAARNPQGTGNEDCGEYMLYTTRLLLDSERANGS